MLQDAKPIQEALREAADVTIQFKNAKDTPVSVSEASLKWVKLEGQRVGDGRRVSREAYLLKPNVKLINSSDKRITAVHLEFVNARRTTRSFFERTSAIIEPGSPFAINNRVISFGGDPTSVVVQVVGVLFEDGSSWGEVPPPPPPPPPPGPRASAPPPEAPVEYILDPRAVPPQHIIRKSGGILQGSVLKRVQPSYPLSAKEKGVTGAVVVEVTINEEGDVESARATTGPEELKEAALDAARQWKFTPTRVGGSPVKVIGSITFNFTL
jgi:TonB family protein